MDKEIVKSVKGLLSLLEDPHSQERKIEIIDEQIETLEVVVRAIQSNWIPKPQRLKRAMRKKNEIDAELRLLTIKQ